MKQKCSLCKKRIVIAITCAKCNETFCIKHREYQTHSCKQYHLKRDESRERLEEKLLDQACQDQRIQKI